MAEMKLTVGKIAVAAGVGVETIRFYERQGLIEQPRRQGSGYRTYPEAVVQRIHFIKAAQELGFTLREIRELIALENNPSAECGDVHARARTKLGLVEKKIADLQRMKAALQQVMMGCAADMPLRECKLLHCLA